VPINCIKVFIFSELWAWQSHELTGLLLLSVGIATFIFRDLSGTSFSHPIYSFSPSILSCYSFARYVVHRHEANYVQVVYVDYLDYDYDDYFRSGRVEKQLAN